MKTLRYKESIFERAMRQTQNPRESINTIAYETRRCRKEPLTPEELKELYGVP